uniref:Ammonium transporter n=1 Tax=Phaeomonas parva TaxID=124430 RepID=A0A7S1UFZ4_9STRA|mmetsp:Transcript_46216/g.144538  ORF Transcript_46216/g.144538 Transcript_46216/m.144538 type:complete len:498 (+) Transcript_46216:121-1614(+)
MATELTNAQLTEQLGKLSVDGDTYWLMFGAILVFFMQAGFGMLEVGCISQKNTKNILVKNVLDACFGCIIYWTFGFGIAFGDATGSDGFAGDNNFLLTESTFYADRMYNQNTAGKYLEDDYEFGAGYNYAFFFFQFAFAATCATIVSGAVAERIRFEAYVVYAFLLIGFVYPVVACWGWNGDGAFSAWSGDKDDVLFGCGAVDFAGSGVVHMTGGVAALSGAIWAGPRNGRFGPNGEVNSLPEQNPIFAALGTFILWVGWYGFNGASTLYITHYSGVAAKVMVVSTIGAAAAGFSSVIFHKFMHNTVDLGAALNGVLGGLVSITGACAVIEPYGAFIIGLIGGVVYQLSAMLLESLKIDDCVNAAPVHMFCGMWGVIAAGLFATEQNYSNAYYSDRAEDCAGIFYGGNGSTLGANICFMICIILWVGATTSVMFGSLKAAGLLRLTDEQQATGMDILEHGGPAWVEFQTISNGAPTKYSKVDPDVEIAPPSKVAVSN